MAVDLWYQWKDAKLYRPAGVITVTALPRFGGEGNSLIFVSSSEPCEPFDDEVRRYHRACHPEGRKLETILAFSVAKEKKTTPLPLGVFSSGDVV